VWAVPVEVAHVGDRGNSEVVNSPAKTPYCREVVAAGIIERLSEAAEHTHIV
jgi:hypothetical protein